MTFTASQSKLCNALQRAKLATQGRHFLPVCWCVVLDVFSDTLKLTCSNADMQVSETIPVTGEMGQSVVRALHLFESLSKLDKTDIKVESKNGKLVVSDGRSSVSIPEDSATGFVWLNPETTQSLQMPANELRMALRGVCSSIYDNLDRPELKAVLVEIKKDGAQFVSSNGHVIATSSHPFLIDFEKRFTIHPVAATTLISLLEDREDMATILVSDSFIKVEFGSTCFTSKLGDKEFPDFKQAFQMLSNPVFRLELDRKVFLNGLEIVSTAKDASKWTGMDMELKDGTILMSATGTGSAKTSIPAQFEGQLKLRVDAGLLRDILSGLDGPTFTLEMTDHLDPLVIRAGAFVGLVCPLRK